MKALKLAAEHAGHSWRTVKRAKDDLGIVAEKIGMDKGWQWRLSPKEATNYEEGHLKKVEPFGDVGTLRTPEPAGWEADL